MVKRDFTKPCVLFIICRNNARAVFKLGSEEKKMLARKTYENPFSFYDSRFEFFVIEII